MPQPILALAGAAALAGLVAWITGNAPAGPPRDRSAAPRPADPGPIDILVMGTSLTLNATWPDALADALQRCAGRSVMLHRHARAGANSGWGRDEAVAVAALAPDLVTIEFAINDADLRDGVGRTRARDNLGAIVAILRAADPGVRIVLLTTNPVSGLGRLTRPGLGRYYADYHELAEDLDLGLVDGLARWRGAGRTTMRDAIHPRPEVESALLAAPLLSATALALALDCPAANRSG